MKIIFFSSKPYVETMFNKINQSYNFKMTFHDSHISPDNISLVKGFDVVCLFVNDHVTVEMLHELKNNGCKMIALRCSGFNNIPIDEAKKIGIQVVRVPAYSPYAVAEYAFALLLTLNRKIHKAYNRVRDFNFNIDGLVGFDLNEKTIGIIGTGAIGKVMAKIAVGFGMKVMAYDIYKDEEYAKKIGFAYYTLEEIYKNCDVISLHCPLTKDNHHLINDESLAKMKKNVFIINISRGALIETVDLIKHLKNGHIGAVALDVYEEEEQYFFEDLSSSAMGVEDDILARILSFNNTLVTSHQGFLTNEALDKIATVTLTNIHDFFANNKLTNVVHN